MRTYKGLLLGLGMMTLSLSARGHARKTVVIDDFCAAVRHEFVETAPRYFSGPNPWVQLDTLPDEYPDAALATVYSEGSRIAWVVLAMTGPDNAWSETTNYFFDEAGLIRKRDRLFEQPAANVLITEATYFAKGKALKTTYHHGPLNGGKENWDALYDPDAPSYTSTADLPVSFQAGQSNELAANLSSIHLKSL